MRAIASATSFAALTYLGFDAVTTMAEDVKNPRKNVLLAAVSVCLFTGFFGGLLVYLGHLVWPNYHTFTNIDTAFIDVTGRVGGVALLKATALLLVVANIGAGLTSQVGAARLLFGMGRENVIPSRYFARLHPIRNTPDINIILLGIVGFVGAQVISYELAAELLNFGAFLGFMGVNLAVIWKFWVHKADERGRNFLLDVVLPALGFLFCAVIWVGLGNKAKIAGCIWLVVGFFVVARQTGWFQRPIVMSDPSSTNSEKVICMRMKKFINDPKNLVAELLEGMVLAFPDKVQLTSRNILARAVPKEKGKVRLVTLGGSGHEPGLSGFVGKGMLDVSVAGDIFAAPGAPRCLEAIRSACAGGESALLVVLNHAGDVLSGNLAMEMALREGHKIEMMLTHEDLAGGPNPEDRRGLVGFLPVYKVAGAAAEQGASLAACLEIALRMERNMRSLAVAVNTATHPSTGQPIFELGDDEMEIGMGQHGEAGTGRMQLKSADETAEIMLNMLLEDLNIKSGEEILVLINGAGATTLMEMLIVFRRVAQLLTAKKIKLARSAVGEFITTQEQAGFQMLIARMDPELIKLWDAPADAPFFVKQ